MAETASQQVVEPVRRVSIGTPAFPPRARDGWLFVVGLLIFWFLFNGPPAGEIGGFDLRFGLEGPASGNPWKWAGALLVIALVIWGERRGLTSLLITKPTGKDIEWAFYVFGGVMTWSWIASLIAPQEDNDGVGTISSMSVTGVVLLIITAAITEEVVYRGYLQERLGSLMRSRWIGAAVSLAIFIAPHVVFFGPSWLFHQLVGSLALVAFTLIRRNLVATMLLHLLINAPILIPTVLAKL
ncbi:membrane protease YdiL (CAAX protease family) [Pseudoclavibacter sp. JAI123]|uniref:CPBP family intramembrane glutamic endopeptidase n=1 Tax=Pseudoclavibacter sp. JAI123 TaxID=2723065 RepID=UPI0015CC1E69|nr:CPBP family intramembrane glutamic endopeptidase [Pseudoclavibacter sp. JAI123]NYF14518.1 membrane protease YdiL (CAAX protease family) [Pseudoclavibacter sp. JAI123]